MGLGSVVGRLSGQTARLRLRLEATGQQISERCRLPDRFKGTFLERWADYWSMVAKDYKDVAVEAVRSLVQKPARGIALTGALSGSYYAASHNPDESSFRDCLLNSANSLMFISPLTRNPRATQHLKTLELYHNQGLLRRLSLGVLSVIWVDNYDPAVGSYKATSQYLSPTLSSIPQRIIDVGFLDRWWLLEDAMVDCDVNPDEWDQPTSEASQPQS